MSEEHIIFSANKLRLEGLLHLPEGRGPFPAVVMCHPHPLYGGDMYNPVVRSVCRSLVEASIVGFRFNYRGVGKSQGYFADGIGEQDDLKAAIDLVASIENVNRESIALGGYSFGTQVAVPVALQDAQIQAIAMVSPFLPASDWEKLRNYLKPKLILAGGEDQFIPVNEVQHLVAELSEPKEYEIIPKADHFWWGYDIEVAKKVANFFTSIFKS